MLPQQFQNAYHLVYFLGCNTPVKFQQQAFPKQSKMAFFFLRYLFLWSQFGHPILRRSFRRVLRLYDTSPFSIFLVQPLSACYGLSVILPCFISPCKYVHCHGNHVFFVFSSTSHYKKSGAHHQEPATPIISQCNGIFTDQPIFRYLSREIGQFQST